MTEQNYKTNSRKKILQYLIDHKDRTVEAKDISRYMDEIDCSVNTTTIYRYLDKLEKDGNVIKYASQTGNKASYQYVDPESNCREHLHLKCSRCSKIIHLDCHFMDEIAKHIETDHGFRVQCDNSVIYGICDSCRNRLKK